MTLFEPGALPLLTNRLLWSAVAVLLIYLMGLFLSRIVCRQLSRLASRTAWKWDDHVVDALQRGIPLWSIFFGCYVALGFWDLAPATMSAAQQSLYVLWIISVTLVAADLAGKLVALYGKDLEHGLPVATLTEQIARIGIFSLGLLTILHGLGISIVPLLTALGVGGIAVALGLQDTLANLFSGFYLTVAGNVRVGDYVRLETGQEGYVQDVGWRETKLLMLPNNVVLVPNKRVSESIITNYCLPNRELAVLVEVAVDYSSDMGHVERITVEVARETMQTVPGGVPSFEPMVRFHSFAETSVNFTVVMRAKEFVDQYAIKHEFVKRLHARYRQEGVANPFPTRVIQVKGLPGA